MIFKFNLVNLTYKYIIIHFHSDKLGKIDVLFFYQKRDNWETLKLNALFNISATDFETYVLLPFLAKRLVPL